MREHCDLNADLGESYGAWRMGDDEALLAQVSSCNIACGFHAGDPLTMHRTVTLAVAAGVAIGAHPSLPDLIGFGRRQMQIDAEDLRALTLYQVAALAGFTRAANVPLHHVKAHGALYGMLATDPVMASAFVAAVKAFDAALAIYGPPQGALATAAGAAGLRYLREGFADRGYAADGNLLPRGKTGALLPLAAARQQGLRLARAEPVAAANGEYIEMAIDTLCVHGDSPGALILAQQLRQDLLNAGLRICAP
jgi:5-oxoprolinase (ATP-hydrolysing) subunit A